ncbi:aminoglycoside phosphotransferase family protein [Micromonospora sp. DR5-3]|uniref:phosphotransferase family protein n=1 Tax=unclassified Micromonospora TaxID=2617518 RepID=UPI0011D7ECA4|nr:MULTISPECIES: phosphotransferase [unclassified Micromonospora]MCW3816309.1 aminoglycoside phosphotransferase family protein [Micromonospora sp. DR5-3]TYC23894.1 phosphotransferase [Micromonospora sp. MP36]
MSVPRAPHGTRRDRRQAASSSPYSSTASVVSMAEPDRAARPVTHQGPRIAPDTGSVRIVRGETGGRQVSGSSGEPALEQLKDLFARRGYRRFDLLGEGMEGVVFALGDGHVGKLWFRRQPAELRVIKDFYEHLGSQDLPFAVPRMVDVDEVRGRGVTIEHELPGRNLRDAVAAGDISVETAGTCMLTVVTALARTTGSESARRLTVLDEPAPMWQGSDTWAGALRALVDRRVAAFGPVLANAVDRFDEKVARVRHLVDGLRPCRTVTMHGDLVPANVLVTPAGEPATLLDWGFLSTEADPAFEASIAAGVFDMYGPAARSLDDEWVETLCRLFGHTRHQLLVYRAVYALLTSNSYDAEGKDGHFAWCAVALNRPDITEALWSDCGAA